MQTLFAILNLAVLPFWFLVVVLPGWSVTKRMVASPWILVPLPAVYAAMLLPKIADILPLLLKPDLDTISNALATPEGTVLAWVHFLAFDLFVGRWIYLDAEERRLPYWLSSPVLTVTLMFGPLGLLIYLLARPLVRPASPAVENGK